MKTRDYLVWFVLLVIFVGGYFLIKKPKVLQNPIAYPTPSIEEKISGKFGGLVIPNDADKSELNAVSGLSGLGIATKRFVNGKFTVTVIADLPEPAKGSFYQAWLTDGRGQVVNLGDLGVAKGGYLVDFSSMKDYSDYKSLFVSLENKRDASPEQHVLEGSF